MLAWRKTVKINKCCSRRRVKGEERRLCFRKECPTLKHTHKVIVLPLWVGKKKINKRFGLVILGDQSQSLKRGLVRKKKIRTSFASAVFRKHWLQSLWCFLEAELAGCEWDLGKKTKREEVCVCVCVHTHTFSEGCQWYKAGQSGFHHSQSVQRKISFFFVTTNSVL